MGLNGSHIHGFMKSWEREENSGRRKRGSKVDGEELLRRERKVSVNLHTIVWRRKDPSGWVRFL